MAAHRKRPLPPARMADLLVERKRELLADGVELTPRVFERAWSEAWEVMVEERAWPHATEHRRQWRSAMVACKSEMRAAFLGRETAFARLAGALQAASVRMEVELTTAELPRAFLGAVGAYGATGEDEVVGELGEALRA